MDENYFSSFATNPRPASNYASGSTGLPTGSPVGSAGGYGGSFMGNTNSFAPVRNFAGSGVMNTGNDAFSNFTDASWQRPAYAQYPMNTANPAYRNTNFMPWYTPINSFTAGQIMAMLGARR